MQQKLFNPVYNPFSKYADKHEKKVDKFLNQLAIKDKYHVQKQLLKLIQENLVVTNLWLEKQFKGYKYLTKHTRKKLYKNASILVEKFKNYEQTTTINKQELENYLLKFSYTIKNKEDEERLTYIYKIMLFLRPNGIYEYLESASFGKLLKNPEKEKLLGDCNQIVTLYIFLYSLKYPLRSLKIKLLPQHVCIHYNGIDIEATNATFQLYTKYTHILPITEIISTNLLDTVDFRDKTLKIDPRVFVKGAKLAYQISSIKDIITKNLQVAYHNIAVESLQKHEFDTAIYYINKLNNNTELKQQAYNNAAIYYADKKKYKKALYYASEINDQKLKHYIKTQEGWHYYQKNNLKKALQIFTEIQNKEMIKACYSKMYKNIQKKVANITTLKDHKAHKNDYRKMIDLAKKMEDYDLAQKLEKFISQF